MQINYIMCICEGDNESNDIVQYIRNAPYECLFHDKLRLRFRAKLSVKRWIMSNAVKRLEDTMETEAQFWAEPIGSNILTFLYWCSGEEFLAKMYHQNYATLMKYPSDITALTIRMIFLQNQGNFVEAKSVLEIITNTALQPGGKTTLSSLACEGEIGSACMLFGPKFYHEAIGRFEKVIEKYEHLRKCNRLTVDIDEIRQVNSWHFYLGRAYNRLFQTSLGNQMPLVMEDEDVFINICYRLQGVIACDVNTIYTSRAMIELITAVQKRTKTKTHEFIAFFETAYGMRPDAFVYEAIKTSRDDPYVLQGSGKYYRNRAKKARKPQNRILLNYAIKSLSKCPNRHMAWHQMGLAYRSLWKIDFGDETPSSKLGSHQQFTTKTVLHPQSMWFLEKSKLCFSKAMDLCRRCRYAIDISQACQLLGQLEEAQRWLEEAQELVYTTDSVEEFEIYDMHEQWVGLKLKQAENVNQLTNMSSKATAELLTRYRQAARAAVLCKSSALFTTDRLKDVLREQIRNNKNDEMLQLEHEILQKATKSFSKSDHAITEALRCDKDALHKAFQLVRLYYSRNETGDASVAFLYLTALFRSGHLDFTDSEHCEITVNIAQRVYTEMARTDAINLPMRDVYRWIVFGGKTTGQSDGPENEDRQLDVSILASSATCAVLEQVRSALQDHLALNVAIAFWLEHDIIDDINELLQESKLVMVIADQLIHTAVIKRLHESTSAVCLITSSDSIYATGSISEMDKWPRAIINNECSQRCVASTLFSCVISALYSRQPSLPSRQ